MSTPFLAVNAEDCDWVQVYASNAFHLRISAKSIWRCMSPRAFPDYKPLGDLFSDNGSYPDNSNYPRKILFVKNDPQYAIMQNGSTKYAYGWPYGETLDHQIRGIFTPTQTDTNYVALGIHIGGENTLEEGIQPTSPGGFYLVHKDLINKEITSSPITQIYWASSLNIYASTDEYHLASNDGFTKIHIMGDVRGIEPMVNGGWSYWSPQNDCDQACGSGKETWLRTCDNPVPSGGGYDCVGPSSKTEDCNLGPCAVDGGWTEWTANGDCNEDCGDGEQIFSRSCTNPLPEFGGAYCDGLNEKTESCNLGECPIHGGWTDWKADDPYNACGSGQEIQSRTCTNPTPAYGGTGCSGLNINVATIDNDPCPVDGGWSEWGIVGPTYTACGEGQEVWARSCDAPAPQYGGAACDGSSSDFKTKINDPCPTDGGWSDWSLKTPYAGCGDGQAEWSRTCDAPAPLYGGASCVGDSSEMRDATGDPCPIDGKWTDWSLSTPYTGCGDGQAEWSRSCDAPAPQYGGASCSGDASEMRDAVGDPCPIDGGWSDWSLKTTFDGCGSGQESWERTCSEPTPKYGGAACVGPLSELRDKTNDPCVVVPDPIDGGWSKWTRTGPAYTACGVGDEQWARSCNLPVPQYGGADCDGILTEQRSVSNDACVVVPDPIDGGWSTWARTGDAYTDCGDGRESWSRSCNLPTPQYGGADCDGKSTEIRPVSNSACPVVPDAAPVVPDAAPVVPDAAPVVPDAAPVIVTPSPADVLVPTLPAVPKVDPLLDEETNYTVILGIVMLTLILLSAAGYAYMTAGTAVVATAVAVPVAASAPVAAV
jgi:hypothetical protein